MNTPPNSIHRRSIVSTRNPAAVPARNLLPAATPFVTIAVLSILFILGNQSSFASDPTGIFALIDKVVLEPNDAHPERIQIWGAFCLAEGGRGDQYAAPKTGFLYLKLPAEKADVVRKEWADLKSVAGQREVIGFGTRYGDKVKVRNAQEKPGQPESYPLGWGLVRMKDRRTDYPPVRQLLALSPETKKAEKKH